MRWEDEGPDIWVIGMCRLRQDAVLGGLGDGNEIDKVEKGDRILKLSLLLFTYKPSEDGKEAS